MLRAENSYALQEVLGDLKRRGILELWKLLIMAPPMKRGAGHKNSSSTIIVTITGVQKAKLTIKC